MPTVSPQTRPWEENAYVDKHGQRQREVSQTRVSHIDVAMELKYITWFPNIEKTPTVSKELETGQ